MVVDTPHRALAHRSTGEVADAELFAALRTGDAAEREWAHEVLVHRYAGLVRWIASRYCSPWAELEELQQVGYLGLLMAIRRFDPDRGVEFSAFARPTVQGEIRRYFRDRRRWIQLPRRIQELKAQLLVATEEFTHRHGRAPSLAELAAATDREEAAVLEALAADDTFVVLSLDVPVGDGMDESTLGNTLGEADGRLALVDEFDAVRPLIAALPRRDQLVLHMRFFEDQTQAEIGACLGISQMQVSRLLCRILGRLRVQMETFAA
jgi:RNA polymerase sigma-B factor